MNQDERSPPPTHLQQQQQQHVVIAVEEPNQEEEEAILSNADATVVVAHHHPSTVSHQQPQLQQNQQQQHVDDVHLHHHHSLHTIPISNALLHHHPPPRIVDGNIVGLLVPETELIPLQQQQQQQQHQEQHPTQDDVTTHGANYAVKAHPMLIDNNSNINNNNAITEMSLATDKTSMDTKEDGVVHGPDGTSSLPPPLPPPHSFHHYNNKSNNNFSNNTSNPFQPFHHPRHYNHHNLTRSVHAAVMATTHVDDDLLTRALSDAGRWAFGTMLVELWVMSDDNTKLIRPPGGWWLNPTYYNMLQTEHQQQQQENGENNNHDDDSRFNALRQLFDPSFVHYEEPHPVSPTVGLAGVLWRDVEYASSKTAARLQLLQHPGSLLATATTNLVHHVLDRSRNRGASQHGSGSGGSINGSRHSNSVNGSRHRRPGTNIFMNVLDRSRHKGTSGGGGGMDGGDTITEEDYDDAKAVPLSSSSLSPPPHHHQQQQQHVHQQQAPVHHQQQQQHHQRPVAYRDLEAIAMDPDQPYHRRIDLLLRCGLTSAAAVAFDVGDGHQGIVIFMTHLHKHQHHQYPRQHFATTTTTAQHASDAAAAAAVAWRKFRSPTNEAYWRAATDMVGAVYAMRGPRRAMVAQRQDNIDRVLRRLRAKLLCLRFMGIDISQLTTMPTTQSTTTTTSPGDWSSSSSSSHQLHDGSSSALKRTDSGSSKRLCPSCSSCLTSCTRILTQNSLVEKTVRVYHKCYGGNVPPPPPFTWEQTMWTFFGVFATLLMLTRLNEYLERYYGADFEIVLGPFGALMTLLYGLSAAPASQPRNVVMGQAISLVIAMSIAYAQDYLPLYLRQGLATAVAVAAMVKLGITHPPAGASALLFCSGDYGWINVVFMLIGNIMAVIAATIINNMSDKRQYPIYWGLGPILDLFETTDKKKRE